MMLVFTGLFIIVIFGLSSSTTRPANFMNLKDLTSGTVTLSAFYTAMLAAFWAYQGWVSVGFIGGEVKDPTQEYSKRNCNRCFYCYCHLSAGQFNLSDLLSIPQLDADS